MSWAVRQRGWLFSPKFIFHLNLQKHHHEFGIKSWSGKALYHFNNLGKSKGNEG